LHVEQPGSANTLLYTVGASFPEHPRPRLSNKDDPADLVLDVSAVVPAKTQAALCHRTQHALFVRRPSLEASRQLTVPEVILSVESLHRAYPPADSDLDNPLIMLLKPWVTHTAA
jgi:hypothetical protein